MPDLNHSVPVSAPPAKVYDAVATEKGMQGWWTADTRLDPKKEGKAEFGFDNRAAVFRMTIEALEPGKSVRMICHGEHPEWNGTRLEWTILPDGGGSILNFVHRGWREMTPFCASCNSTWGELMYRLKGYVESGRPAPRWTA